MSQRVEVQLIDDLDGTTPGAETITFGIAGHSYELELAPANSVKLQKALAPYIAHARLVKRPGTSTRPRRSRTTAARAQSLAARAWARQAGISVNTRGRVPAEVLAKWEAAGKPGA